MGQLEKMKRHQKRHLVASLTKLRPQTMLGFVVGCVLGVMTYPMLYTTPEAPVTSKPAIPVCFSPGGHCTNQIIAAIDEAQTSILVMAYSFTSTPIAEALINAYERGVDVKILIDRSQLRAKHSRDLCITH